MRMLLQYGNRSSGSSRGGTYNRGGRGARNELEMRRGRRSDGTFMTMGGSSSMEGQRGMFASSGGGDFDPQLVQEACEKIREKLENPPQTWERYLENDRIIPIIRMEYDELKRAIHEVKEGHRSPRTIDKELVHLAAALVAAHVEICEEEEG